MVRRSPDTQRTLSREYRNVIRNPLKSLKEMEEKAIENSLFIHQMETAGLNKEIKELERLIRSLSLSDQLGLHGKLNIQTLEVVKDYRDQINIHKHVKEHMIWYYFSQQEWREEFLEEVINIYGKEGFIAMESIIVSALKEDQVEEHQIETIRKAFDTKEIEKQINKWCERKGKN